MPSYTITAPDGATFDVEGDSPPTEKELEQIYSGISSVPNRKPEISPEQEFVARYVAQQQSNPLQKAIEQGSNILELVKGLGKTAKGGVQGLADILGEGSISPSTIAPNLAQTGVEAGSRLAYDIANAVRQQAASISDAPLKAILGLNPITALIPRTPSSEEVSDAYQRELVNQAFQDVRSKPIAEEILGKTNIPLAEALPLLVGAPEAASLKAAIETIPAVEAVGRAASGISGAVKGGAKMAVSKITPKPLVENIVNTLDARSSALNPAKQVQAVKTATQSVQRVIKDLTPEDLSHPQTLADTATSRLQDLHLKREALSGKPVDISLDPLADVYEKMANDPVIRTAHPDLANNPHDPRYAGPLQQRANQLRGEKISGSDAERFNQILNAQNQTLYEKIPGARAAAEKADPMLAAGLEASKVLRSQLDDAFGAEFGELGKDYGAWKNIADLAQRQAVKQAKIENKLSLYEGLSGLQAIASSGSPIKAASSLAGGQILKFAGSPLARFESSARRLAEAKAKGQVP